MPAPRVAAPELPIETGIVFTNFSKTQYAAFRVRAHATDTAPSAYFSSYLLAPGATQRIRMLDAVETGCAQSLDVQVFLYRRLHPTVPIGLDAGEPVEQTPVAAGEIADLPACSIRELESYTFTNFDAPEGIARVKYAQGTPVDDAIVSMGLFPSPDHVWEVSGVQPDLANTPPPQLAPDVTISGSVTDPAGNGLEGVGVLVRTRFRERLDDGNPANDPDAGYGDPIDVTPTDAMGMFEFLRPAGAYLLEFFADGLAFRPVTLELEAPSEQVNVIAEPAP